MKFSTTRFVAAVLPSSANNVTVVNNSLWYFSGILWLDIHTKAHEGR
jgi:hypothetical protein